MTRIKIKCRGTPDKIEKLKLLEILFSHEIHISRCFVGTDGFAVLPNSESDSEKIFKREIKDELDQDGFSPLMPADLRVKKSVILARVDNVIYDWGEEEIGNELVLKNSWIGDDLDSVYKFPNSSTIKITFSQTSLARKCTEIGLHVFNISIPPHEIKQETFIPIKCCMKCYCLEEHNTRDCPKGKEYKLCSECSNEGHLWF